MTSNEIKAAYKGGDSTWEILGKLTASGIEYPDAEWLVTKALGLKPDEVAEMRDGYDNKI